MFRYEYVITSIVSYGVDNITHPCTNCSINLEYGCVIKSHCFKWQALTLRHCCMPGAYRFCPRHVKLCGYVQVIVGHMLIFPAVYISFAGLLQILTGHMKIFAGHWNFENHMPHGHVNQMLNVNICMDVITYPCPIADAGLGNIDYIDLDVPSPRKAVKLIIHSLTGLANLY